MAWKFPTRKNYENWLASQKAEPASSNEETASNTNTNVSSTSIESNGPVFLNKPKTNRCVAGFGGKKYKKVNGKWVSCGGRRKTVGRGRRKTVRRRRGSTRRR